tara:strand:+ start:605 stop:898 length:294 start_codon:yes stop_codon:yes gene_type:complete
MKDNIIIIGKKDTYSILKISFLLLVLFIFITILLFNIYKGRKFILPSFNNELREKSDFHLLKSMGISILITILFGIIILSKENPLKNNYAVNKIVKI